MAETQTPLKTAKKKATTTSQSPRAIEIDIDRIRADMDRTLDELMGRLKVRHVLDRFMESLRGPRGQQATGAAKRLGKRILHQIGQHPMPVALVGSGVAWLVATRKGSQEKAPGVYQPSSAGFDPALEAAGFQAYTPSEANMDIENMSSAERAACAQEQSSGTASSVAAKASNVASRVKSSASQAADKVRQWSREKLSRKGGSRPSFEGQTSSFKDRLSDAGSRFSQKVQSGMETARGKLQGGTQRISNTIEDYPLVIGISALAIGVAIALAIPASRRERRMVRSGRAGKLADQARELLERGKEAAMATAGTIKEEARRQGLTPQGVAESVKDAAGLAGDDLTYKAQAVAEAGKETLQHELRSSGEGSTSSGQF